MFGKKKGQAAMEYLMTYGWAILAVVIVGGVLYYYGVFEPDLPDQGCPGASVAVEAGAWDYSPEGSLRFIARNNAGQDITIDSVNVTVAETEVEQSIGEAVSIGEQTGEITIDDLPDMTAGDTVEVDMTFTYDGALEGQRSSCTLRGEV